MICGDLDDHIHDGKYLKAARPTLGARGSMVLPHGCVRGGTQAAMYLLQERS